MWSPTLSLAMGLDRMAEAAAGGGVQGACASAPSCADPRLPVAGSVLRSHRPRRHDAKLSTDGMVSAVNHYKYSASSSMFASLAALHCSHSYFYLPQRNSLYIIFSGQHYTAVLPILAFSYQKGTRPGMHFSLELHRMPLLLLLQASRGPRPSTAFWRRMRGWPLRSKKF